MLKNQDIICVALPSWRGDYMKSTVQLMTELAKHNRVLYVDYQYTYKDKLRKKLPDGFVANSQVKIHEHEEGELLLYTPHLVMPTNWISNRKLYNEAVKVVGRKLARGINQATRSMGFRNPVVVNAFNPQFGLPLYGELNECAVIYYCYDEISEAVWCRNHGPRTETAFMQKADATIVSSTALLAKKSGVAKSCHLVKNGVDINLFSQAYSRTPTLSKTIGYIGSIDDRIDYKLLAQIAETYSNYTIKLVGRVLSNDARALATTYDNVVLTGPMMQGSLAHEVSNFAVGLIPFVKSEFTRNIYPLKINEYLAAGLPVVTSNFSDLTDFTSVVSVTNDRIAFVEQIGEQLTVDSTNKRTERAGFALANSWTNRAAEFGTIVQHVISQVG